MDTRKVFRTGHSIAVTIPKNIGVLAGDVLAVERIGESSTIVLTKVVKDVEI